MDTNMKLILMLYFGFCNIFIGLKVVAQDDLPTLYEYYTEGGIESGLEPLPDGFQLNGKNITIFSGAIHYFRVHPGYWRDRLRKLRALGFNAVETYVPWDLHEPEIGVYDFGDGDNDFSPFLDIVKYVQTAKEEDLLVVIRSGPFIAAEWDNGGLPAWLLRDPEVEVRTYEPHYIAYMTDYLNKLFPLLTDQQFTEGGPIIAFQIENEYAYAGNKNKSYLQAIKDLMDSNGITSLQFTTDTPTVCGTCGALDGVFMTANFGNDPETQLNRLKELQPDKPFWVMEYWTGWFDLWFDTHHTRTTEDYIDVLERIFKFPSSVNLYMFHGGTNYGFMNGASTGGDYPKFRAIINSYDYDAPLSESGDYTEKYNATIALVEKYNPVKTKLPPLPEQSVKEAYPNTPITGQLTLSQLIDKVNVEDRVQSADVIAMELLDINNGSGQTGGFAVYHKTGLDVPASSTIKIEGVVHDVGVLLINGIRKTEPFTTQEQSKGFGYWETSDSELPLDDESVGTDQTLVILVENCGHGGEKGLFEGSVLLNDEAIKDWDIVALQFKKKWVQSLSDWDDFSDASGTSPTLYRAVLNLETPHDTFLDMRNWGKGSVFVNGFNIGRYFPAAGPARTMYIPAPMFHEGDNEILVFELYVPASELSFSEVPILA